MPSSSTRPRRRIRRWGTLDLLDVLKGSDYLAEFTRSLDATIDTGFLLEDDRAELLAAQTAKAQAAFAASSTVAVTEAAAPT